MSNSGSFFCVCRSLQINSSTVIHTIFMRAESKNKLLKGAAVLAVCAIIAKLIGALYRVPLTNIIGTQGIGLYQMVFPLYTVLLTVSSGGLPVAISRVVAERTANNDEAGARQVLFTSLCSLALIGAAAGGVLALLRNQIAAVQGNGGAAIAYLGIAPSILFVAVIAAFRGYYQGRQNMLPSAVSQLLEQAVKLTLGLTLARIMFPLGIEYGVLGAVLGVSASEFITMLYLSARFFFTNVRYRKRTRVPLATLNTEAGIDIAFPVIAPKKTNRSLLKEVYRVAIPVTFGSLVMPITQVIDSIIVINILSANGMSRPAATGAFGLLTGPIGTLLNMPVVITLSFAIALLPKVSECFFKKESADGAIAESLKYNLILGLLAALIFGVFGKDILLILYAGGLTAEEIQIGAMLLRIGSVSILYVSLLQVATAVLQGVNLAHKPAVNLLYGTAAKVILTLALLPFFGLLGAMAASCACYGITCILDIRAMKQVTHLKLDFREFLLGPLTAGVVFSVAGLLLSKLFLNLFSPLLSVILALTVALVAYFILLLVFKSIKLSELKEVPLIGRFIKRTEKRKSVHKAAE